ncbi:tripartite tricarboxylate transporter substrate binding protein [Bacillus sp. Marseille-P3661]|uniref:tripartite tricarboxylate transporter substrate binding protein n=1 Tax=Bacillus sp. Marseille-P3661 TaxID=1936234 RepID=UPI0015E18FAE|nr:tripartite tricarboxylate transporter substrate binding protein [Bacillus sp. Marseille-P3661]
MKRIFSLLMVFSIIFFIVGCSGSNTSSSNENNSSGTSNEGKTESSGPSYPEREITLIVPYSPGGGYDTAARMLAPYWEKYLPNDVSIVVENKPGGNGNIALGELATAGTEGYTVGLVNIPGHFVNQVLGTASYDLTELNYIGNITKTIYVAGASKKSGYTTLEDFQNAEEIIAGITNISSTDGLGVLLSAENLGVNVKTINHKGSTEAILSATRGDVNWVQFPVESLSSQFDSGEIQPLWVYNNERLPELPDVPTIAELGHEELLDSIAMYRVIAAPPGTPDDILTILRESFMKAVNDEEYKQKVEESGALWNPGDHVQVEKAVNDSLEMLKPHKQLLEENS